MLPRLLERAGRDDGPGSITGLYTVLVEGDDMNDPIGDSARSIWMVTWFESRVGSTEPHPAIDVLVSASRVMGDVASAKQAQSGKIRELLAAYRKAEDLVNIGAYRQGANPTIDRALAQIDSINQLLRQKVEEDVTADVALGEMSKIVEAGGGI